MRVSVLSAALIAGCLNFGVASAFEIVAPTETFDGKTYGDWSAEWWKWTYSIPATNHPLIDTDGSDADANQSGNVWFLAGTFSGGTSSATRSVNVPAGKALFFPLVNVAVTAFELGLGFGDPSTPTMVESQATSLADLIDNLVFEIDGSSPVSNLFDFRAKSPVFSFDIVSNDVFGLNGTSTPQPSGPSVADGYWVMLKPLSAGEHLSIRYGGSASSLGFTTDVLAQIRVVAEPATLAVFGLGLAGLGVAARRRKAH